MINRCEALSALLLPIKSTAWHYLQILGVAPRVSLYVISPRVRSLLASAVVLPCSPKLEDRGAASAPS